MAETMLPQDDIFMETTNNMLCLVHIAQSAYEVAKLTEDVSIVPEKLVECKKALDDLNALVEQAKTYAHI